MSTEIKIPSVGESITSGVLSIWHKKSGDLVKSGDTLITLETDKVSQDIAAEVDGKLEIAVGEGREVKIGEVVGSLHAAEAPGAESPAADETEAPAAPDSDGQEEAAPETPEQPAEEEQSAAAVSASGLDEQSPAVRRIAAEEDVDLTKVEGSGNGGRITKEDVLEYLSSREEPEEEPVGGESSHGEEPAAAPAAEAPQQSFPLATQSSDTVAITTRKRLSPLRQKIARALVNVQQEAAILTTFNECDMTAIKEARARMQESFQKRHGIKLGFMSFFIKAVVNALKEVPSINGRIEGDEFVQNHFYDIGVAVGTDRGLMVPVVRDADKKSFSQLENDLAGYAQKARDGKIGLDDLRGGVFTISNGGVYGSLLSTPILNPPQSGILGMHTIQDRPVAMNGEVCIRPMMYLALSYDHRVVDGKEAVTFLVNVKNAIEDPMQLIL